MIVCYNSVHFPDASLYSNHLLARDWLSVNIESLSRNRYSFSLVILSLLRRALAYCRIQWLRLLVSK